MTLLIHPLINKQEGLGLAFNAMGALFQTCGISGSGTCHNNPPTQSRAESLKERHSFLTKVTVCGWGRGCLHFPNSKSDFFVFLDES